MHSAYLAQACGQILNLVLFRGGVLPLYALLIGANNIHLGLLSGLPEGMAALTYVVSPLVARYGKRRWLATLMAVGGMASLGLFAVQPIHASLGSGAAVAALIMVMFLQTSLTGMALAGWWPLLREVIPPTIIGSFFGRLRTIFEAAGLAVLLLASTFLGAHPPMWRFIVMFGVAAAGQLGRAYFMSRMPDPTGADPTVRLALSSHLSALQRPLRDRSFSYFCLVTFTLAFLVFMPLPLYVPYLKLSREFPTSLTVVGMAGIAIGSIISLIPWGRHADRKGPRALFMKACLPLVGLSGLLVVMPRFPDESLLALVLAVLTFVGIGVGVAGFGIAYTGHLFHCASKEHSSTYMGLHMLSKSLAVFIGPLVGGTLAELLKGVTVQLAGLTLGNYQIVFVASAVLLAPALVLARGLRSGVDMQRMRAGPQGAEAA